MSQQPDIKDLEPDSDDSLDGLGSSEFEEKKLIISGLVKKMKYYFLHNTRQLILFSNSTLEYHDPERNIRKGVIRLTDKTVIKRKDSRTFTVTNPEREFIFKTIDVPADRWVLELRSFLNKKFH